MELNQVVEKYEKGEISLDNVSCSQIFSNNKFGLEFFNFDKPSTSPTIFLKATKKFNNQDSKKKRVVNHHKKPYDRNNFSVN